MDEGRLLSNGELHYAISSKAGTVNSEEFGDGHSLLELGPPDNEGGKQVSPSVRLDLGRSHPQLHHELTSYGSKGEPKAGHQHSFSYGHVATYD